MSNDPRVGSTISHYRILSRLGKGGMGVVYAAEDLSLGRKAAIKFLTDSTTADPASVQRFLREAKSASALNHPNICTIYEFGEHEGHPFLAMELLDGVTLDTLLTGSPTPLTRLLDIGIQAADALDAAHRKGIIHRDIKPANIFIVGKDQVKLLDFGLAKLEEAASDATSDGTIAGPDITSAGSAVGTIAYMSPEQARGETLDARTDIFSLGTVLYQLATGQHPFPGRDNGCHL